METSGVLFADCAFLQQSGILDIGQEPSRSCAPTPTTLPTMAATRTIPVNHLRIVEENYINRVLRLSR